MESQFASHPLGVFIAVTFVVVLCATLLWMLLLPQQLSEEVAKAVVSVETARVIVVPILDLYYSERAVELACRLGKPHNATLVLAYILEVPRVLTLDADLPDEIKNRAKDAIEHAKQIVKLHGLNAHPEPREPIRSREASEGIRKVVKSYGGDLVVLGIQMAKDKPPTIFTRTVEALLRRPPCEILIDIVPAQ
jgi:nucleotide-binding universal stress UspA family protein